MIKTSKNTIENNKIAKNRTQGGGISLSGSNNNIIKGNGITDNNVIPFGEGLVYGVGIRLFSSEGNSIIGNKIIKHNSGIDLSASGRNSIEENILDSNWHGIYLRGDDCTKNTITKNQITNNKTIGIDAPPKGTGIYFFQSTSNNDTEIKYNNFSGNEDKAIRYEGKEVLDATLNWWGDKRGPSIAVSENGKIEDKGMIKYQEWLCEPYETDWVSSNGVCVGAPKQIGYNVKDGTPNVVPTIYSCEGGYTSINGVSIHWSDSINKSANLWYERQYSRNGIKWEGSEICSNLFTDYKSFGYGEVPHFSRVRAFYDINGNKQYDNGEPVSDWSNICSITYDKTKPEGSIDHIYYSSKEIKVKDFITNDKNPILGGTCFDSIGLDSVKLKINEEEQNLSCNNGEWKSSSFNTLADGIYEAILTLTDLARNSIEVKEKITIDTKPPTATHRYYRGDQEIINQPVYVKSTSELSFGAEYFDDGSRIFQDSYVIFDSNNEGTARTSKAYCSWRGIQNTLIITENPLVSHIPFSNCTVALSDGAYFMYHQVYDNAIRKDIPPIKQFRDYKGLYFIIDNIKPKSTFNLTDTFHNSSILLKGTTIDENNVDYVNLYYSVAGEKTWSEIAKLKNNGSSSPFDWSYSWEPTEEGIYDIYASGTDLAGNEEHSAFLYSIVYDITKPEISLVTLINGVLREITADDKLSGLESIKVKVGDGKWEEYKEGMNLNDMVNRTPGTHIVYIKVRDKAGNEKETQKTFTIPAPFSDTLGEVLGAFTEPFTPQPVQAQTKTSATTQLLAQSTQEEDLPETKKEAESSETKQKEEIKDIQARELKNEDGEEEEKEGLKWWVYILILLPLLFFFLTLYKRRKEEEEK